MTDLTRIRAEAEELRAAARAYYDSDTLLMSDAEYDEGLVRLREAAAASPELADEFHDLLEQVAAGQSSGGDVKHPTLMGSLDKVTTLEGVKDFVTRVAGPVTVEPKLDGLAARVVYQDGRLALVATRGDGRTGEDITQQARNLNLLPTHLRDTPLAGESFELRGEVFMWESDFPAANRIRTGEGGAKFVNSRNAAAGILRRGAPAYQGMLQFAAYDAVGTTLPQADQAGFHTTVTLLDIPDYTSDEVASPDRAVELIDSVGAARAELKFPIDGVVIKAARREDRERLGEGSSTPRWAVAYKYEAESAITKVVDITTDVGRTGRLAIRLEVEPVFVGGATVTYASGHNVSWMQERDIRIGDTVRIERANDVIPYVSAVLLEERPEDSTPWAPPESDPLGNPWDKSTLLWRSTSPELSVLGRVHYATGRDCLDIEGIGMELATALVEQGLVTNVADLFFLDEQTLTDLTLASGRKVGQMNASKIMQELEKAKNAAWNRVITALGIRATGRTMGRRLAAAFPTMDKFRAATVEDLASVDGIGLLKAEVIREGVEELANAGILDRLAAAGVNMGNEPAETATTQAPLEGAVVAVTGRVGTLNRTEVQERIEALGGRASSSVSTRTTILVANPDATSSKVKRAKELGIQIKDPDEFLKL